MKNQKGFLPIIIILIVLMGIGGVYYLGTVKPRSVSESLTPIVSNLPSSVATSKSATPDPTANWKIYNASTLKITFKYPQSWNIEAQVGDNFVVSPDGKTKILIMGMEKTANSTAKDSLHNYLEKFTSYGDQGLKYLEEKSINIDSTAGWLAHIKINSLNQEDKIFFVQDKNNNDMYQGLWITNISNQTRDESDKIISTFKFTN